MSHPSLDPLRSWCHHAIELYLAVFPEEAPRLVSFRALLETNLDLRDRRTVPGHVTGSGLLFDTASRQLLLIHHVGLNRWLQPGGHVDGEELPAEAARREVLEEVGIEAGRLLSISPDSIVPVDIDSHIIPANARKAEPAHMHHDFRFAFAVNRAEHPMELAADEVADAVWMGLDDPRFPADLVRVANKLLTVPLFAGSRSID